MAGQAAFGPGAEAVAGHNLLIGDPGQWPGLLPTITFADNTCGMYAVLAVTDALARRDLLGTGSHLDISLYETAVSQLGTVLAERGLGAVPERNLNGDAAVAFQGTYVSGEPGRYVAVSVPRGAQPGAAAALGAATPNEGGAEAGAEGRAEGRDEGGERGRKTRAEPRPVWRPPSRPGPPPMRWRPCRPPGSRPPWSPTPPP